ncbi:MAG: DUF485 domain-containing protein [Rhodocyclaceae bacterium]|nr:DUF485 domain-containing protein [Rhodocyclaceae bacterium]
MAVDAMDWAAIQADPRFQRLHRRKTRFLAGLMVLAMVYFFLLPLGAAWAPELFATRLVGHVNVGIAFAFSEFLMVLTVAAFYLRRANREFDRLAEEIEIEIHARSRRPRVM